MSGALPKDHRDHVFCNSNYTICVPTAVHAKLKNALAGRYNGDRQQADATLRAWYPVALSELPADTVMGDAFKFWQILFDPKFVKLHVLKPTEAGRRVVPGADATSAYLASLEAPAKVAQ